jgi:small-conductance mechanosensitive channel
MEWQGMIRELFSDLQQPDLGWQVLALVTCLLLGLVAARLSRARLKPRGAAQSSSQAAFVGRLIFPLLSLALLLPTKAALALVIHTNLLKVAVPLLVSLAIVRGVIYVLRQAFSPSGWLAASERFVVLLIWGAVALHITGLAPVVIDALEQVDFNVGKQHLDLWMILHGVVTVFATLLVALWISGVIEGRLMAADRLDSSVRVVMARLAKAVLTLVAILVSLSLVGIDVTTLSVFGGALGVGLGFGLQKIASNYVSGFIILLDRSIRLGNVIALDAVTSGVVTQITTRFTVLRGLTGTEYIVPNELLVAQIVQNQSFTDSRVFLKTQVQVACDTDVEKAMALLVEAAQGHARTLADAPPRAYLTAFADSGINLEVGFWINDPQEGTGNVRSDVNVAIWRAFKAHGIVMPFPQREVRLLGEMTATTAAARAAIKPAV